MPAPKLDQDAIAAGLESLNSWELKANAIELKLDFYDFLTAIAFITQVAPLAEAADHHPEIFNVYNRVTLVLTTHDSGGLTHKDFDLAAQIDALH